MNSKALTTKEVARLCRVSDATVKRWDDAGLVKSERTNGGHRRFRAEEVAKFQQKMQLGLRTCLADESALTPVASRRRAGKAFSDCVFFQSLLSGSETDASNILINQSLKGKHAAKIFDELVCEALMKVGELWAKGTLSITQEHLASRVCFEALSKLRGALPVTESNGKTAMCCALEGDLHELPPFMVQIILESLGYEVTNFGANTPLFSFADEVSQSKPDLVCISGTIMENPERVIREYRDFRAQAVKNSVVVVLGGRVFKDKPLSHGFEAEAIPNSFSHLCDFARKFAKD